MRSYDAADRLTDLSHSTGSGQTLGIINGCPCIILLALLLYLQTHKQIGYVVIDVAASYSDQALKELKAIDGVIRCRVLF